MTECQVLTVRIVCKRSRFEFETTQQRAATSFCAAWRALRKTDPELTREEFGAMLTAELALQLGRSTGQPETVQRAQLTANAAALLWSIVGIESPWSDIALFELRLAAPDAHEPAWMVTLNAATRGERANAAISRRRS